MNATEDEELDQAWDSLPPPAVSVSAPSLPPATEEVDSGWDDVPEPSLSAPAASGGKKRPHRQRRAKTNAVAASANPVLLPRPAEPTKKQHREQARKARAHEAQVKQRNKEQRKAERAAEAREQAEARLRQTEAEERARQMRREARERAESERPPAKSAEAAAKAARKAARKAAESAEGAAVSSKRKHSARSERPKAGRAKNIWPAVIMALLGLALAAAVASQLLRK